MNLVRCGRCPSRCQHFLRCLMRGHSELRSLRKVRSEVRRPSRPAGPTEVVSSRRPYRRWSGSGCRLGTRIVELVVRVVILDSILLYSRDETRSDARINNISRTIFRHEQSLGTSGKSLSFQLSAIRVQKYLRLRFTLEVVIPCSNEYNNKLIRKIIHL